MKLAQLRAFPSMPERLAQTQSPVFCIEEIYATVRMPSEYHRFAFGGLEEEMLSVLELVAELWRTAVAVRGSGPPAVVVVEVVEQQAVRSFAAGVAVVLEG